MQRNFNKVQLQTIATFGQLLLGSVAWIEIFSCDTIHMAVPLLTTRFHVALAVPVAPPFILRRFHEASRQMRGLGRSFEGVVVSKEYEVV